MTTAIHRQSTGMLPGGSTSDGASSTGDESGSPDGSIPEVLELTVILPNGEARQIDVSSDKQMIDLQVQVAASNQLSPAGYVLIAVNPDTGRLIEYKASQSIGSLGVDTVELVSKKQDKDKSKRHTVAQPFEITHRLGVNLPRNQKYVLRVSPAISLAEVFKLVCEDKSLDPYKHELRHPTKPDVALNMASPLSRYGIAEITVVSVTESHHYGNSEPPSSVASIYDTHWSYSMPRQKSVEDPPGRQQQPQKSAPAPTSTSSSTSSTPAYMPGMERKKKKSLFSIFSRKKGGKFNVSDATYTAAPVRTTSLSAAREAALASKPQAQVRPQPQQQQQQQQQQQYAEPQSNNSTLNSRSSRSSSQTSSSTSSVPPSKPPRKKRNAPPPPPGAATPQSSLKPGAVKVEANGVRVHHQEVLSHSRGSSHSSGFDEPNVSPVESPSSSNDASNRLNAKLSIDGTSIESAEILANGHSSGFGQSHDLMQRRLSQQSSTTSTGGLSTSGAAARKKRRAPAPPQGAPRPTSPHTPTSPTHSLGRPAVGPPLDDGDSFKTDDLQRALIDELRQDDGAPSPSAVLQNQPPDGTTMTANPPDASPDRAPCHFVAPPPPSSPPPPGTPGTPPAGMCYYGDHPLGSQAGVLRHAERSTQVHVTVRDSLCSDGGSVPSDVDDLADLQSPTAPTAGSSSMVDEEAEKSDLAVFVEQMEELTEHADHTGDEDNDDVDSRSSGSRTITPDEGKPEPYTGVTTIRIGPQGLAEEHVVSDKADSSFGSSLADLPETKIDDSASSSSSVGLEELPDLEEEDRDVVLMRKKIIPDMTLNFDDEEEDVAEYSSEDNEVKVSHQPSEEMTAALSAFDDIESASHGQPGPHVAKITVDYSEEKPAYTVVERNEQYESSSDSGWSSPLSPVSDANMRSAKPDAAPPLDEELNFDEDDVDYVSPYSPSVDCQDGPKYEESNEEDIMFECDESGEIIMPPAEMFTSLRAARSHSGGSREAPKNTTSSLRGDDGGFQLPITEYIPEVGRDPNEVLVVDQEPVKDNGEYTYTLVTEYDLKTERPAQVTDHTERIAPQTYMPHQHAPKRQPEAPQHRAPSPVYPVEPPSQFAQEHQQEEEKEEKEEVSIQELPKLHSLRDAYRTPTPSRAPETIIIDKSNPMPVYMPSVKHTSTKDSMSTAVAETHSDRGEPRTETRSESHTDAERSVPVDQPPAGTEESAQDNVCFWGPRPWSARGTAEPSPTQVHVAVALAQRQNKHVNQSRNVDCSTPVKSPEMGAGMSSPTKDINFSPRSEEESQEIMEEKSISMIAFSSPDQKSHGAEQHAGHYTSSATLAHGEGEVDMGDLEPRQYHSSLALSGGGDSSADINQKQNEQPHVPIIMCNRGAEPHRDKDNVRKKLQSQYTELQQQFTRWQHQLTDNQQLLEQKKILSGDEVPPPEGAQIVRAPHRQASLDAEQQAKSAEAYRRLSAPRPYVRRPSDPTHHVPAPNARLVHQYSEPTQKSDGTFATEDLAHAKGRLRHSGLEEVESHSRTYGSQSMTEHGRTSPLQNAPPVAPPAGLPPAPSQPPQQRGRGSTKPAFEPKLDPREQLMMAIRNNGGRSTLRTVSVEETNWRV